MSIRTLGEKFTFFAANFTNNRPICFLSTVSGVRDMLIGLGFIFELEEIRQTRLFQNYDELIPGITGMVMGWLFLIVGLVVAVTAIANKTRLTPFGLRFQASAWLFSAIMYGLSGDYLLAIIFGIFFSIPAGYLAFYYKYAPLWEAQKRRFRQEWAKEHDVDTKNIGGVQ